jgi:hypothetical protein
MTDLRKKTMGMPCGLTGRCQKQTCETVILLAWSWSTESPTFARIIEFEHVAFEKWLQNAFTYGSALIRLALRFSQA